MGVRRLSASAALVLLLAGCGGDPPKPKFSDSPSESASSSATASESPSGSESPSAMTEPTPPREMAGKDEAAAEAFVEHYFELVNYAQATGQLEPVRRVAAPVCAACDGMSGAVEQVYRKGGTVRGGALTLEDLAVTHRGVMARGIHLYDATATVKIDEQLISGSGNPDLDGHTNATTVPYEIQVSHNPGKGWLMLEWTQAP